MTVETYQSPATATSYGRFRDLLDELFQFDRADLDFGIYRIINQRRDEIRHFLDHDLLPQVNDALGALADIKVADKERERDRVKRQLEEMGVPYDTAPRYRQLTDEIAATRDQGDVADRVYSDLYTFFRRYYDEGDFISQRRYKAGVYAIPYEGEEVKLHWANADQYYVKTAENFQDYRFRLDDGRPVGFRLAAAAVERDNNKEQAGKERRFVLRDEDPIAIGDDGELLIFFEYRPDPRKQADLNAEAAARILDHPLARPWRAALSEPKPTQANPARTLLAKRLAEYTAKNTFDYFIHKDLGTFLRRELDFFLKNEVMHLDDLDTGDEAHVESYLARLRAIKRIGGKIIDFLAQIEEFQKRLYLKKKFVVAADYLVTLDRLPDSLHAAILANDAQWAEWERLFAISQLPESPVRAAVLAAQPHLVLDTRFFDSAFKRDLLASLDDLDKQTNGLLINSENFQALNLIRDRYEVQIKCIYIDPPFNLGADADFLYKTNYIDSTWLTLLENRISESFGVWANDGLFFVRCDYHGSHLVRQLMESLGIVFKAEILLDRSRNEAGSANKMENTYEHLFMYAKEDIPIQKFTVPRSLANIKWTGFLMAGDRNPPQRTFLGKVLDPPKGQHFALRQDKVGKLLREYHLRLKCRSCSALYYHAPSTEQLERRMKAKSERFKLE